MGEASRNEAIFKNAYEGTGEDPALERRETELAGKLARVLTQHYPGYTWGVYVTIPGGICGVKLATQMQTTLAHVIHLDSVSSYPEMCKEMRKVGGELLERFRLSRTTFSRDAVRSTPALILNSQKMPE